MKSSQILIVSALLGLALSVGINYSAAQGSQLDNPCTPAAGAKLSPVNFINSDCAPYGDFSLQFSATDVAPTADTTDLYNYQIASSGTFKFNGTTYTTEKIAFHAPAEHKFFSGNAADLEMQIYFKDSAGNRKGALAFLFTKFNPTGTDAINKGRNNAYTNYPNNLILSDLSSNWKIQLPNLANIINSKDANDLFLNVHYYKGTPNYPSSTAGTTCSEFLWFVYGGQLLVTETVYNGLTTNFLNNLQSVTGVTLGTSNSNALAVNPTSNTDITKLCYTGYFQVTMYANYGLWFSLGLTLLFFIFTLSMETKPLHNLNYVENVWTHHPIYSVWFCGNDIYTRKTRSSLIFLNIISHFVWNAVFFKRAYDNGTGTDGENVITFALQSVPIGWGITYIAGYFLRKHYILKHEYETSRNDDVDDWAQFYIYIYYFCIFVGLWLGLGWTVALMDMIGSHVDGKTADLWVAAVFISMALEWFLFDPIAVWLCKVSDRFRRLARWKGFLYDDICHKTYLDSIKRE